MRRLAALLLGLVTSTAAVAVADPPLPSASAARAGGKPSGEVRISAARISTALDRLVREVEARGGTLGVSVVDLASGERVARHAERAPFNPASNMKIVTAWAALKRLGAHHRYLTGLYGQIRGDGVTRLGLRGDGDPSLEHHDLWDMAARLHRAGVRRVGEIVVDQSAFDGDFTPPAFAQQPDEWASFRAPVAAVSVAGNSVLFEVRPTTDGAAARVTALPSSFVDLSGTVVTGSAGTTEAVVLSLAPKGDTLAATMGGKLPLDSQTLRVVRRVDDPRLLAGYALRDVLAQIGVTVEGGVAAGAAKGRLLSAHRSATLGRLLHQLGKKSDNFYAEMVFLGLSRDEAPARFARSATIVREMLDGAGIDTTQVKIQNGSGLFDANRLPPGVVADLLRSAFHDPSVGPELMAQLSIGGTDGTLRARMRALKGTGAVRAKTGTLAAVSSLSGYVLGVRRYALSIMINDVRGHAIPLRTEIDRFVEAVVAASTAQDAQARGTP